MSSARQAVCRGVWGLRHAWPARLALSKGGREGQTVFGVVQEPFRLACLRRPVCYAARVPRTRRQGEPRCFRVLIVCQERTRRCKAARYAMRARRGHSKLGRGGWRASPVGQALTRSGSAASAVIPVQQERLRPVLEVLGGLARRAPRVPTARPWGPANWTSVFHASGVVFRRVWARVIGVRVNHVPLGVTLCLEDRPVLPAVTAPSVRLARRVPSRVSTPACTAMGRI